MRRTLPALLVLGAVVLAACGDDDDDDDAAAATTAPAAAATTAPATVPAEAGGSAADCAAGKTIEPDVLDDRDRRPGLPAVRDQRRHARGRAGLRGGGGDGRRPRARFRGRQRHVGAHGVRRRHRARPEGLRLQPPAVRDHARASRSRSTSARATTPRRRRSSGSPTRPPRRRHVDRRPEGPQDRRRRRHDQRHVRRGDHPARLRTADLQRQRRRQDRHSRATRSTPSSADLPTAIYITTVEIEGTKVFGQIEGSGTESGDCCSPRTARSPSASTSRCRR